MSFLWNRRKREEQEYGESDGFAPGPEFFWEIESGDLPARFQMEPQPESLIQPRPGESASDYVVERTQAGERHERETGHGAARDGQVPRHSRSPFSGLNGARRVAYVRYWLDDAVERWRQHQELPGIPLLRDGLLLLETGVELTEAQRLLLLRAALAYHRGVLTALRHQQDLERTAYLVAEAMLRPDAPLTIEELTSIRAVDPRTTFWYSLLLRTLIDTSFLSSEPWRSRAQRILDTIQHGQPTQYRVDVSTRDTEGPPRRDLWMRATALVVLFAATLYVWWHVSSNSVQAEIFVPGGDYIVSDPIEHFPVARKLEDVVDGARVVVTKPFDIDRTEVTNREYRACYERRACAWPSDISSASRSSYFLDSAYDDFPLVHVTWLQADRYCRWRGGRLPQEVEWEIAAGAAYGTTRRFRFPWGDHFAPGLANAVPSQIGDTVAVGQYHPAGSSPFGLWDAAGNVAEWTATAVSPGEERDDGRNEFVVKGGSFRDEREQLLVGSRKLIDAEMHADWLGFRCIYPVMDR